MEHTKSNSEQSDIGVALGPYRLFPRLKLMLCDGEKIKLTERTFDVLWVLVQANGKCVTKDTLLTRVWGDEVVEENNLQAHISTIRRALGRNRDMIVTEFGRGYRIVEPSREAIPTRKPPEGNSPFLLLPAARHPMVGRDRDLASLVLLLGRSRFVTIVGPGGVGKTTLALEAARASLDTFNGRVHFVEMAAIVAPEAVWPALADALGIGQTGPEPTRDAIAAIRDRRILVIIDNCEHLAGQISRIVELLRQLAPDLHVLVTSQQVLNADGEYLFRLTPLAVPPIDAHTKVATLEYSAVQLFVERVTAHMHEFVYADTLATAVGSICRRVDGIPLAIELAAARVPTLGVAGVLEGLADRFQLLTSGRRNASPRHQTLRAAVSWSESLLSDTERYFFRSLSVFFSSFTLEAAHVIAGFNDDRWSTADLLASLVQKSLVHVEFFGSITRYRLLESLREYAWEQLSVSDDIHGAMRRHTAWFSERSEQALADWKRMPTRDWREVYRPDSKDIRGILARALSGDQSRDIGIRLLANAIPFWVEFSMLDDCRHWVSFALADSSDLDAGRETALQAALGASLTWARGPTGETRTAWTRALTLAQESHDVEIELQARYGLWLYGLRTGNHAEALLQANAMLDAAASANDVEAAMVARRIVGTSLHVNGDQESARGLVEASLHWHEDAPPPAAFRFGLGQHAAGLAFLARILWLQGHTGAAVSTAEQAAANAAELDHACTLCCVIAEGVCTVAMLNRDVAKVQASARTLIETAARHGLQFWKTYGELFEFWAAAQVQPQGATFERTVALLGALERTCFNFFYTPVLMNLIDNKRLPGQTHEVLLAAALRAGPAPQQHWAAPEFMRVFAAVAGEDEEADEARCERALEHALAHAKSSGMAAWALRIATDLARRLVRQSRDAEARVLLSDALSSVPDGNNSADWLEARTLFVSLP